MFNISCVTENTRDFWFSIDKHITKESLDLKIFGKLGYVIFDDSKPVGIMHYCILWDSMPFLNLIYIHQEYRKCGFGKNTMEFWEKDMKGKGFKMVLISTQVDEKAQFFYRKLGYRECGSLVLNDCPLEQPMEMFMGKVL